MRDFAWSVKNEAQVDFPGFSGEGEERPLSRIGLSLYRPYSMHPSPESGEQQGDSMIAFVPITPSVSSTHLLEAKLLQTKREGHDVPSHSQESLLSGLKSLKMQLIYI